MDKDKKKTKPWTGHIDPGEIYEYIKKKQKKIQAYQVVYFIRNNYIDNQRTVVGWSPMLFFFPHKKVNFHKSLFSKARSSVILNSLFTLLRLAKRDIKNSAV